MLVLLEHFCNCEFWCLPVFSLLFINSCISEYAVTPMYGIKTISGAENLFLTVLHLISSWWRLLEKLSWANYDSWMISADCTLDTVQCFRWHVGQYPFDWWNTWYIVLWPVTKPLDRKDHNVYDDAGWFVFYSVEQYYSIIQCLRVILILIIKMYTLLHFSKPHQIWF